MNKKLATVAFIIFLALTSVAYASYSIYSNIVKDEVTEYTIGPLTKDSEGGEKYTNVTFTGQLLIGSGTAEAGKTIYLLRSTDNSTWTQIATNTTTTNGYFTFAVNRTESGTFFYKARFDTP